MVLKRTLINKLLTAASPQSLYPEKMRVKGTLAKGVV
jgi:hypothetical protein